MRRLFNVRFDIIKQHWETGQDGQLETLLTQPSWREETVSDKGEERKDTAQYSVGQRKKNRSLPGTLQRKTVKQRRNGKKEKKRHQQGSNPERLRAQWRVSGGIPLFFPHYFGDQRATKLLGSFSTLMSPSTAATVERGGTRTIPELGHSMRETDLRGRKPPFFHSDS